MTNFEAIETLTKNYPDARFGQLCEAVDAAIVALKAVSSENALEVVRWVPCTERLPEKEVLCCDTRGNYLIGWVISDEASDTGYSVESDECYMFNCIAWMPMPKAYKEV